MSRIFFAILFVAASARFTGDVIGQSADDIVQKHITAIGGEANWNRITSLRKTCSRLSRGVEIPSTIAVVQGKGYRSESTTNGMTSYTIITDKEGWTFNPRSQQKPDAFPAESVKLAQDRLDIRGYLVGYKAKGSKIVYLGIDEVEGTECHKLKLTLISGKEVTVFIDASTYYLVRTVEKARVNGKESLTTTTYNDYQKQPEGIVYPMAFDYGGPATIINKLELNIPINENTFKP